METVIELPLCQGTRRYGDFFGFAGRHPRDLDGIDDLMPTEAQFHAFMDALNAVSPAPISFVEIADGRNGCYGHAENRVYVNWRISPAMAFRTALHEMVHAILHPWPGGVKPADEILRAIREVEAEGVAYLVCLNYGLDTGAYSVDYVNGWMRHLTPDEAEWSTDLIRKTAKNLVESIDAQLEKQGR